MSTTTHTIVTGRRIPASKGDSGELIASRFELICSCGEVVSGETTNASTTSAVNAALDGQAEHAKLAAFLDASAAKAAAAA